MKSIHKICFTAVCLIAFSSCLKEYDNPAEGTVADKTFMQVVRSSYSGSEITINADNLAGATSIQGVVITDRSALNIEPNTFAIQQTQVTGNQIGDLTRGIMIKMTGDVTYNAGDSLLINIVGGKLGRINGILTISGIGSDKITKLAENRIPLVRPVTIGMLNSGMDQYESTLVAVHADVSDYSASATFSGDKNLNDGTGQMTLRTRTQASFAGTNVPVNAQFNGIAGYYNASANDTMGAKKTIIIRNANDIKFSSGALYPGYPESFETPDFSQKASYNITTTNNDIALGTGSWKLTQAIIGNTVIRDKINPPGKQCVRIQQNLTTSAYVQMNYDLPNGASKVTVFYGKYYTDPASTFRLEYSINGGTTWVVVSPNITDMPERGVKQATFPLNIAGNVRFRFNKLGLGASSSTVFNGRLCLDDISIYKKL